MRTTVMLCFVASLAPPLAAQARVGHGLEALSFLAGCWGGSFGGGTGTIEEFYTRPSSNLILGTTRYLRDGAAIQYEFTRIERDGAGAIVMTPYPNGRPSEHGFRLTSLSQTEAVFEAPEHDYPKRIIYRSNPDGTRTARIDGGAHDTEGREWHFGSIPCRSPGK